MRTRYIQLKDGSLVEARESSEPLGVLIVPDLPGYQSPVTGLWVEGRAARREDLKRTGSRPWEGLDSEKREAQRQTQYHEQKVDAQIHDSASRAYYQMPQHKRDVLNGR